MESLAGSSRPSQILRVASYWQISLNHLEMVIKVLQNCCLEGIGRHKRPKVVIFYSITSTVLLHPTNYTPETKTESLNHRILQGHIAAVRLSHY